MPERPVDRKSLLRLCEEVIGCRVPDVAVCPGHCSPVDYLVHAFLGDFAQPRKPTGDCCVWANRGGGKTNDAALATLLDCVFKPGTEVRILGGSGEQSGRMYKYLTRYLRRAFPDEVQGRIGKGGCRFRNGSVVEVLTQSPMSVRGQHVQKLRCDEVELFDEDVFDAAKFTTHTSEIAVASMELLSTVHRPYGLMQREVSASQARGLPVFKWCVWETIEPCRDRACSQCPLWGDCQGKARHSRGYLRIDDMIAQMSRASRAAWEAEMLCLRPSDEKAVLPDFDPAVHVRQLDYSPNWPLCRSIDFGFVNPFVCLWIQEVDGMVHVLDEYVRARATLDAHVAQIKNRLPVPEERIAATFCDPAGAGRDDITGSSAVRELRSLGIRMTYCRSTISEGLELIRRALRDGVGQSSILISPRCVRLIEALQCYHYPDSGAGGRGEAPFKDGVYDHPIDALRYYFVNRRSRRPAHFRPY
jgi:hypothetical protein